MEEGQTPFANYAQPELVLHMMAQCTYSKSTTLSTWIEWVATMKQLSPSQLPRHGGTPWYKKEPKGTKKSKNEYKNLG
jgi:hypothetical protein